MSSNDESDHMSDELDSNDGNDSDDNNDDGDEVTDTGNTGPALRMINPKVTLLQVHESIPNKSENLFGIVGNLNTYENLHGFVTIAKLIEHGVIILNARCNLYNYHFTFC